MSQHIMAVIRRSAELERLLTQAGGEGKGLGEKARSLEGLIAHEGTQAAKTVSWLRNRCAHEAYEPTPVELHRFNAAADRLTAALAGRRSPGDTSPHEHGDARSRAYREAREPHANNDSYLPGILSMIFILPNLLFSLFWVFVVATTFKIMKRGLSKPDSALGFVLAPLLFFVDLYLMVLVVNSEKRRRFMYSFMGTLAQVAISYLGW